MGIVLTRREEELMSFLWDYGEPLAASEILAKCTERTWSDQYLQVMIRSLEKKGAIEPCGMLRVGNHYARKFHCLLTKEEYYIQLAENHGVNTSLFAKAAVTLAARCPVEDPKDLLQELEQILETYKNED